MNSRRTPCGIFFDHLTDKFSNLSVEFGSSGFLWPGAETPKETKAGSVPGYNRFWLDDNEDVGPPRPEAAEQNPKQSIRQSQFGSRILSLQNDKLLAQGHDLETEMVSGTEKGTGDTENSR